MTEFGANHNPFRAFMDISPAQVALNMSAALASQLDKPNRVLDITEWQKKKLQEL
jgi:hypothetical protein